MEIEGQDKKDGSSKHGRHSKQKKAKADNPEEMYKFQYGKFIGNTVELKEEGTAKTKQYMEFDGDKYFLVPR